MNQQFSQIWVFHFSRQKWEKRPRSEDQLPLPAIRDVISCLGLVLRKAPSKKVTRFSTHKTNSALKAFSGKRVGKEPSFSLDKEPFFAIFLDVLVLQSSVSVRPTPVKKLSLIFKGFCPLEILDTLQLNKALKL